MLGPVVLTPTKKHIPNAMMATMDKKRFFDFLISLNVSFCNAFIDISFVI
jgi:hypothetical protein